MSDLEAEDLALRRRGVAFAAAAGGPLEAACARVLTGASERAELLAACSELLDATASAAGAALRVLARLDEARALSSPPARRAAEILAAAQCDDGSWRPDGADSEDARLQATGTVAGYLGKTRWVRPWQLAAAGDFLVRHWYPERVKGFRWEPIAAHAQYFANVPHDGGDEVLQWCGRELERGFRSRQFDAARVSRVLLLCDAGAIPGAQLASGEIVAALPAEQRSDGGWGDPEAEDASARVEASLAALATLTRFPSPAQGDAADGRQGASASPAIG